MDNRGPLFTLLAVVVLGLALVGINASKQAEPANQAAPATSAGATTTTAPSTAATTAAAVFPAEAAYVGRITDGDASVAIAVKDGKAVAYLCDGRQVEAWLQGAAAGDELFLQGRNGAQLTGSLSGDQVSGIVSAGGRPWPFTASVAAPPAGLYRANATVGGVLNRIGWIVQKDNSKIGILNQGGNVQPAPPLDPTTGSVALNGDRVPVEQVAGDAGAG